MWIGLTKSRGAGGLIKRLDVKRPDIRARGDMIGIPLPNILVIRHFQERTGCSCQMFREELWARPRISCAEPS